MTSTQTETQKLTLKARNYLAGKINLSDRAAEGLAEQLNYLGYESLAEKVAQA
jgi:hypothetical protein